MAVKRTHFFHYYLSFFTREQIAHTFVIVNYYCGSKAITITAVNLYVKDKLYIKHDKIRSFEP